MCPPTNSVIQYSFNVNQVSNCYNIPHLYINSDMSYEARAGVTLKFTSDPSIRILFFLSMGAIGLNLSIANIVIFLVCYVVTITSPELYILIQFLGPALECSGWATNSGSCPPSTTAKGGSLLSSACNRTSDVVLSVLAHGKKHMCQYSDLMELMIWGVAPDKTDVLNDQEKKQLEKVQAHKTLKPKPWKMAANVMAPSTTQEGEKGAPISKQKWLKKKANAQGTCGSHISLCLTISSWLLNSCVPNRGAASSSHASSCACRPRNQC